MVSLVLLGVALEAAQQLQECSALHQRLVYGDVGLAHRRKAVKEPLVQLPAPNILTSSPFDKHDTDGRRFCCTMVWQLRVPVTSSEGSH